MRTKRISIIALWVTVTAFSLCPVEIQAAENAPTVTAILNKYAQASPLSPALEEIAKLSKAGVAEAVTLAYIQCSPTPYTLDAQDIVRLREQGVSSQVVTAMMQHGHELRRAVAETNQQPQTASTTLVTQAPTPAATTPTPATFTCVPSSSVSVTYFGTPNYACHPGYFGYGYGGGWYPGYYAYAPRYYGAGYFGPRVGFGVGYRGGYAGYSHGYHGGYRHH